jgi:hypothetical protein
MLPQKHRSAHNVIVLLDELRSVRNEADPCEHRSHAHGASEAVGSWIAAGEFEASAGRLAIVVLEPEARPEDPALRVASALFVEVVASRRDWGERADSVASDLNSLLKEDAPGQTGEARATCPTGSRSRSGSALHRERGETAPASLLWLRECG